MGKKISENDTKRTGEVQTYISWEFQNENLEEKRKLDARCR